MTKRWMVALALAAVLAPGCSSGGSDAGTTTTKAPRTTTTGTTPSMKPGPKAPACAGKAATKEGFVRAFCDGPATVAFTIGDAKGSIDGGTCTRDAGSFTINAGTVVGTTWTGARPDYAGLVLPEANGPFSGPKVTVAIFQDGEFTSVENVSGSHDGSSAHLTGTAASGGAPVEVTVTC